MKGMNIFIIAIKKTIANKVIRKAVMNLYTESVVEITCSGQGLSADPMEKVPSPIMSPFHSATNCVAPEKTFEGFT
jgi:hypothetical protein